MEVLEITEIRIPKSEVEREKVKGSIEDKSDKQFLATITVSNLKQLSIARLKSKIKLNTPNLASFRSLTNATFVFPEQMTHLYFDYRL